MRAELEGVGRLETSLGQAALVLAQRIEGVRESGSAVASLTREMRATLVEATRGAKAQESRLESYRDELAARRRA